MLCTKSDKGILDEKTYSHVGFPLISYRKYFVHVLLGLSPFVPYAIGEVNMGIYTFIRISHYLDWISKTIN